MSIAAALSSAGSGLAAVSRATDVVAGNVANALTPGYARRQVILSALPDGGGVRIASVERMVQASLVGDMRKATAQLGGSQTIADFRAGMEKAMGIAGEGTALADQVSGLEAALIAAASRPDNDIRLGAITTNARGMVAAINAAADAVQTARTEADQAISADVNRLRSALSEVARLNRSIIVDRANGRDAAALMDERQRAIDDIASIVPVREVPRDNGRIALFTAGGATLLDGSEPINLTFAPAGAITAGMEVGTAPVSRLVLDGEEVGDTLMTLFAGGSLAAHFQVRDSLAPQVQASLDAFARDLIDRFSDPALDPTLPAGQAGLFTDGSAPTLPVTERGLANRITLNAAFPADGSGDWRWRDGLGAAARGDVGNSRLLAALSDRLSQSRATASASVPPGSRSAASFAAELSSQASTNRVLSEAGVARDSAHSSALRSDLLNDGVDTDHEMQRLLELERAYSANAKVIQAADAMISRILEL